jgi:hypothetical protein
VTKRPGIGKEIRTGGFRAGFECIPLKDIKAAKQEICNMCYWNPTSFYAKCNGKDLYRIYEIEQIDKFFKRYNVNAWTGEPIS